MWDAGSTVSSEEKSGLAGNSVLGECKVSSCCVRLKLTVSTAGVFWISTSYYILLASKKKKKKKQSLERMVKWSSSFVAVRLTHLHRHACTLMWSGEWEWLPKDLSTNRHMHPASTWLYHLCHNNLSCSLHATLTLTHSGEMRSMFSFLLFWDLTALWWRTKCSLLFQKYL